MDQDGGGGFELNFCLGEKRVAFGTSRHFFSQRKLFEAIITNEPMTFFWGE